MRKSPMLGHMHTKRTYRQTVQDLEDEFAKWDIVDYYIPTYRQVQAKARETGLATVRVDFQKNGQMVPLECSQFDRLEDNIRSVWRTVEGLRLADQRGILLMMAEAAQRLALPDPNDPYEVLARYSGFERAKARDDPRAAYLQAVKHTHPDSGGRTGDFKRVQQAATELRIAYGPRE